MLKPIPWVITKDCKRSFASVIIPSSYNTITSKYSPNETRPAMLLFPNLQESMTFRDHYLDSFVHSLEKNTRINNDNFVTIFADVDENDVNTELKEQCICIQHKLDKNMIDFGIKSFLSYLVVEDVSCIGSLLRIHGSLYYPENYIDADIYDEKCVEHLHEMINAS
jgi:hypothetical protein